MSNFLELAQSLQLAMKALQMYTPAHPRAVTTVRDLATMVGTWLEAKPTLHMAATGGRVFVDGAPVEGQSLHLQALARQLAERQIAGFVIQRGVSEAELLSMLQILILKPSRIEDQGGVAKLMSTMDLPHITLGQIQYREVREGEGGEHDGKGPALATAATAALPALPARSEAGSGTGGAQGAGTGSGTGSGTGAGAGSGDGSGESTGPGTPSQAMPSIPLLEGFSEAVRQWKVQIQAAGDRLGLPLSEQTSGGMGSGRRLGRIAASDLSGLSAYARESGWGEGAPSGSQVDGFEKALQESDPETRLGLLKGLATGAELPGGLRATLEGLAPELFGGAATELLGQGVDWRGLQGNLMEILQGLPNLQQPMLMAFEQGARLRALDLNCVQDLLWRLEWDHADLGGRIRMALDQGRLWELGESDRMDFLKAMLEQSRFDPLQQTIEEIIHCLTLDDVQIREKAATTLREVTRWILDPGLPPEIEALLQPALSAHFAWEPLLQIHRPTEEAILALLGSSLRRNLLGHTQDLLQELEGLCAFLEDLQAWRMESLARLKTRLASAEFISLALAALYEAEPEQVLQVFVPYFEFLGEASAEALLQILGEEPDRKRRGRLLEIIRSLGPLAMPALKEGLDSALWYLVRNTLNLMADMGDASLLEDVSRCLGHGDLRVRAAAIRATWKLGGPKAAPALLAIFPNADPETQLEILFGLTQIQSAAAVPVLGEFAKNGSVTERLRVKTAEALGHIGNPAAIPFLQDLVKRRGRIFTSAEPTAIRLAAAQALANIGTPQALEALKALVKDEPRGREKDAFAGFLEGRHA